MYGLINWNTVPMTFNDSWTYLEMLGKCVTQITINAKNIAENRARIEDHEERLVNIETVVIPAILTRLDTIEETMVTKTELSTILEDYATRAWVTENFVSAAILDDYATRAWVTENYVENAQLDNYYTKAQSDDRYALKTELRSVTDDLNSQISRIRMLAKAKGTSVYYEPDMQDVTITDGTTSIYAETADLSDIVPDFEYDAAMVNVEYTVNNQGVHYNHTVSIHVRKSGRGESFEMYAANYGGKVAIGDALGHFYAQIDKPSGTEIITLNAISLVLYEKGIAATPAEKARYFRTADLNGDGEISVDDAQSLLRFYTEAQVSGVYPNTPEGFVQWAQAINPDTGEPNLVPVDSQYVYPDANQDGIVDVVDPNFVLRFYGQSLSGYYDNTSPDDYYEYMLNRL